MEAVPFLRRGPGSDPSDGGCIMQVIDWISTGGWTDQPACVNPTVRQVAIGFNDMADDESRQKLLALTSRLMGTANISFPTNIDLNACVTAFNRRWYGDNFQSLTPHEIAKLGEVYQPSDALALLNELLDICDKDLGRTTHEPVDLSGVCELMATS